MSGVINKIKDVLKHDKETSTTTSEDLTGPGMAGGSSNAGPHSSNLANKADPRVDSDHDGSTTLTGKNTPSAIGSSHGVTTGVGATHRGPHKTETANVLDPNVSSGSTGIGRGPTMTSTTAGPHKSDMMNKLDPRVDSDLDGSKTLGPNKTLGGTSGLGGSNTLDGSNTVTDASGVPLDAATHKPSEFAAVVGDPTVLHDDSTHNRVGRHGSKVADDLQKYGGGHE